MSIQHHLDDATLMSYAAGSLPEALAAVVAAHLDVCPMCRREARMMGAVGVAIFERIPPEPLKRDVPIMALRAMEADVVGPGAARPSRELQGEVPASLQPLIGDNLDELPWKRLGFGVWHYTLPVSAERGGDLRLLKVAPGRAMPDHGHGGAELTLLLRGSYHDTMGTFRTGDVADLDDSVEHRPMSDAIDGCICLIASEKRARFKSVIGRLVQPFTGM